MADELGDDVSVASFESITVRVIMIVAWFPLSSLAF
jgi:hypothetical protein